jgi:hypothetical protein
LFLGGKKESLLITMCGRYDISFEQTLATYGPIKILIVNPYLLV